MASCQAGCHTWNGKADPRHAQIICSMMGLNRAATAKAVATPGARKTYEELTNVEDLPDEEATIYRSVCMRIGYLAQDRPDIMYASKEMARMMKKPTTASWEAAKRCARFLLGKPRLVQSMEMQPPTNAVTIKFDSDHAGCSLTRRSTTGMAVMHGKHLLRASSSTQAVIALSSGESEFYAIVKGVATAIGMQNAAKDLGIKVAIAVETDSVAARGMALRLGAGKIRHIDTQWLWVQRIFHERKCSIKKIPGSDNEADLMTKHLDGKRGEQLTRQLGYEYKQGKSRLALTAAVG